MKSNFCGFAVLANEKTIGGNSHAKEVSLESSQWICPVFKRVLDSSIQGISASQNTVSLITMSFSKDLHASWLEVASVNIFHDQINEKILPWIPVLVSVL